MKLIILIKLFTVTIKTKMWQFISKIVFKTNLLIYPSNIKIIGKCNKCGQCCKTIMLYSNVLDTEKQAVFIKTEKEFLELQKTVPFYQNLHIVGSNSKGELSFECKYLKHNKCTIYKTRPDFCKSYPSVKMFQLGGSLHKNCGFKIIARKKFNYFMNNFQR